MQRDYIDYQKPNVVYIDVDGTLLVDDRINHQLVAWARRQFADGKQIIVWSARGADNAKRAVELCGIGDIVSHALSKPGYVVDDLGIGFTRFMDIIHVADIDRPVQDKANSGVRVSMI
ncbi:hypothetical protein U737_09705 [Methylomonas sp. LW13]|uniref:hypothetical protein n=1 Tax=unclassified Methylomonas TaxID=2608980 RepID=UPI00051BF218|nr:hypothetical protein [Methylomonas sp. LW13]QBC27154.1 hypothetical protein U737_09705 [Methylomonas sp. LW13]